MRGLENPNRNLFCYVDLEKRVPQDHPLRAIRKLADAVLKGLDGKFDEMYAVMGRASIPPEMLLRASLLQAFYSVRSERQLMEQTDYNLLFRWFVGLAADDAVWHPTVFTHNRDRLMKADVAQEFLTGLMNLAEVKQLLSEEHFSVDGTLIEAWASMKSFVPKDGSGEPPGPGRNGTRDFHNEKRSNETHESKTDPDARLYRKADGKESKLCFMGHVLMENRNGLAVEATLTKATGTAEREATITMLKRQSTKKPVTKKPVTKKPVTLGADKAYDVTPFIEDLRERNVTPHIAVNGTVSKLGNIRKTAMDQPTLQSEGYTISQRCRKRIEEIFGWVKKPVGLARTMLRGLEKLETAFTLTIIAYNLIRIPKLLAAKPA